jgi:oligoendopeptidase F
MVLLQKAGVDMATPGPFTAMIARMERLMDEIERILSRQPG